MWKGVCILIFAWLVETKIFAKEFSIPCEDRNWQDLTFENKKSTNYSCLNNEYSNVVLKSSSARLYVFQEVIKIQKFRFEWQLLSGSIFTKNSEFERTKKGDDFLLRVGLIVLGSKPWIPFFASPWIKKVSTILKHPSDRMDYFVLTPFSQTNSSWESPYTKSIRTIASNIHPYKVGSWNFMVRELSASLDIVGIWWMSDGDDTKSSFEIRIKNFAIDSK